VGAATAAGARWRGEAGPERGREGAHGVEGTAACLIGGDAGDGRAARRRWAAADNELCREPSREGEEAG